MAVRTAVPNESASRRAWLVAASLVVLFVVALFLRAYWNLDAAHPEPGTFVLSGGSDPYYHKHAVDAILTDTGEGKFRTLTHDPLLNYPYGSLNPNPPLFQWSTAVLGSMLAPFFSEATTSTGATLSSEEVATWWVFLWLPAILGALTLIPIYFLGKSLFDWRVGLVAALLWAVSTSAIDSTGLGLSDHDAMLLFFVVLSFLFYVKTIEQFRGDGNWVRTWRDGSAVASGFRRIAAERRLGFAYALLTGVSIAAVALVWKGFPYVIGIMFIYAVLQFVLDHWRNRDSTGLFLATALAFAVGLLLAYPFYAQPGLTNFITPSLYILAALAVIGAVLIPTRDLPSLLVMPAALVVGLLFVVVAIFVFPAVAQQLLYATVYFKQTTLYQTIAEAHPADFATIAFGIGPVPFFLAVAGWFVVLAGLRRTAARAHLFALVWAAVALYMTTTAVRFLFNAIPAFAIFGAFMLVWVVDWLDFGAIRKHLAGTGGWAGFRKGLRPLHVIGALVIALFLVVPNALLAADAALPRSREVEIAQEAGVDSFTGDFLLKRFGAYGQSFLDPDWQSALQWLDQHDADIPSPADRPAFLSWWDYGHWAIAVGDHPAVADNFQNGYEYAANFLLSQNETHAVQLLAARQLGLLQPSEAERILGEAGADDSAAARQTLMSYGFVDSLTLAESVDLVDRVEQATGKKIRYFATDIRMMPLDDPQTPSISTAGGSRWQEQASIFYAPVTLAQRNGDDYVAVKIAVGNDWVTQERFTELASNPVAMVSAAGERLEYQQPFFNSMYYRAFVGTPVQPEGTEILGTSVYEALVCALPGYGLEHFRLVYANGGVKILEYAPGAVVSGTVTEEDGSPASGVTVTAYDGAGHLIFPDGRPAECPGATATGGVPHASVTTDASGSYTLRAPFSLENENVTIVAQRDGVTLAEQNLTIPRDQAVPGQAFTADLQVRTGSVALSAFLDENANGQRDANETAAEGIDLRVGGVTGTTDAQGNVTLEGVPGGVQDVLVENATYEVSSGDRVRVTTGGEPVPHLVGLQLKRATLNGTFVDANGEALAAINVILEPTEDVGGAAQPVSRLTGANGTISLQLAPGTWRVNATGYDLEPVTIALAPGETLEQEFVATARDE